MYTRRDFANSMVNRGAIGVQLYSFRDRAMDEAIADAGLSEVEL